MNPSFPSKQALPNPVVDRAVVSLAAMLAVALPTLLVLNAPPSVTFPNQAAALMGWGLFVMGVSRLRRAGPLSLGSGLWVLQAALGLMALAAFASSLWRGLPVSLSLSAVGLLCAAALVSLTGAVVRGADQARTVFGAFCFALVLAGAAGAGLGSVQFFAPELTETGWIAQVSNPSRVGANLRQPNHLSSLLLWSAAALIWLNEAAFVQRVRSLTTLRIVTSALMAFLMLGVVLTVSRTGGVCVVLLALWGVIDKRLSRFTRVLLWLLPVIFLVNWLAVSEWAQLHGHAFAGGSQLNKSDLSSSRFGIWENTLALIAAHSWAGVGWGEFNFAWTLTPFPGRPVAFFDHTHNLPLQLLVELGIPLAGLIMALLVWAFWRAALACWQASESDASMLRTALVMVLMMGVHSMLEYPLWYAYFLLPAAFAFGFCLGPSGAVVSRLLAKGRSARASPPVSLLRILLMASSMALVTGSGVAVVDYLRVVDIFSSPADAAPLDVRIAEGQRSVFFAHHADYAAVTTTEVSSEEVMGAFRRAPHYLLDTRLMLAWARAYAERGDVERARYLAQRLKEFRNPLADDFFAECDTPPAAVADLPFQCTPPSRAFTFEDFRRR